MRVYCFCRLISTCIIVFCSFAGVSAQEPVFIRDDVPERIFPLQNLAYFEDTTNRLRFEQISSSQFNKNFTFNPAFSNKHYNKNATYWVRFQIRHNPQSKKIWILEFYDQTIDNIEAYIPDEDGRFQKVRMGDKLNFESRTFAHKNFELILHNDKSEVLTYYFKVSSHNFADIRIVVRSIDRFIFYALNEYFLYGLFYGMILILSLYNLLMFFAIREVKYIYYIFYLLSVGIYVMCVDGIAFQYLWPNSPNWNQIAYGVFLYSVIIWSLLFSKRFLNSKSKAPILNKLIDYTIIGRSIIFITALFYNEIFEYRVIEFFPLVLIFFTSIYVLVKGFKPARFFVIAYGLLFLGFLYKALVNSGMLPFGIIQYYSLHISFLLEMLFLSFALGDRVRILKHKRDRAQLRIIQQHELNVKLKDQINRELELNMELKDKVNRELEEKVKGRTIELNEKNQLLEESNEKLVQQAKEINQINSMLDLDNWKLKNNVKEGLVDRFINKKLDFEEFKRIFPDKLACYRYLERIKWEKGFKCRKCENDKFFDGLKKFSRRCTRCGYNESITAYTIFHGIKFPIEKAFYITYLVISGSTSETLDQISSMLSLRVNTIWNFKNKILNLNKKPEAKKSTTAEWYNLLLDKKPRKKSHKQKAVG